MGFTLYTIVHHGQYKNTRGKYLGVEIIFLIERDHCLTMHNDINRILAHALEHMCTFLSHFSARVNETVLCSIHPQNQFSCICTPINLKIITLIDKTPSGLAVLKLGVAGDFLLRLLPGGKKQQVQASTLCVPLCKHEKVTTREFRPFFVLRFFPEVAG